MQLKVEWIDINTGLNRAALVFGFDTIDQLMSGKPEIKTLSPGQRTSYLNNLVISGDFSFSELTQVVEHHLDKQIFTKGEIENGTCRKVYPFINNLSLPFRAGLTVHEARGTWSSLPHKFEREEILSPRPMPFYEKFAYITDPPGGWGVQLQTGHLFLSGDTEEYWVDNIEVVRDRDILDIPLGSHPVSAGPGTKLAYIWVYWGSLDLEGRREKFSKGKAL